jgi:hypothetical protein
MSNQNNPKHMTTKGLIYHLQRIDPSGEQIVQIAVMTENRAYPVAYCRPHTVEGHSNTGLRVYCHLPEGMHTIQKGKK